MLTIDNLELKNLLTVARGYLGEICYIGDEIQQIPQELKPFIDRITQIESSSSESLPPRQQSQAKALFLDRDGVINIDHGYVGKVEQVELIPGIAKFINHANHKHYDVNVITNQSGIGRGYYSEKDYEKVMACIQRLLDQDQAKLNHIEFAPYHPDAHDPAYLKGLQFRKPRPGMILKLQQQFHYDLKNSILVGDKASDIMAGVIAGVGRNYLFETEQSEEEWMIFKNWKDSLKKYGLKNELDEIKVTQLTDFSEITL